MAGAPSARAAETDPYHAWLHPPRDSAATLDRMIQTRLDAGLMELNRSPASAQLSCRDAAARMVSTLDDTAMHFVWGGIRSWGVWTSPASRTEYDEVLRRYGVYHRALLLPFGSLVPVDPAVRVGDVLFGTDKIGHFFTNGLRYFDRYLSVKGAGGSTSDAMRAAAMVGVLEESTILGLQVSGIFSFADLQANDRGFAFFRALCDGPIHELTLVDGRWVLSTTFHLARWVDPCWDEGWNVSAFAPREGPAVREAIASLCPRLRHPRVQERRATYRALTCTSTSTDLLTELIANGAIMDPSPYRADVICRVRHGDDEGRRNEPAALNPGGDATVPTG